MQAKREPNPSGANWKYAESVLSEFTKKLDIQANTITTENYQQYFAKAKYITFFLLKTNKRRRYKILESYFHLNFYLLYTANVLFLLNY